MPNAAEEKLKDNRIFVKNSSSYGTFHIDCILIRRKNSDLVVPENVCQLLNEKWAPDYNKCINKKRTECWLFKTILKRNFPINGYQIDKAQYKTSRRNSYHLTGLRSRIMIGRSSSAGR